MRRCARRSPSRVGKAGCEGTHLGGRQRAVGRDVPDPKLHNRQDVILKVGLTTTCGSDLHLLGGYIPAMRAGDMLGHEFMGEVVEVGAGRQAAPGGRPGGGLLLRRLRPVLVLPHELFSLCDNTNPNPGITEALWGRPGGCFGYSHAMGGLAGSHAEYIRVPYADYGAFTIPDGVSDTARCSPPTPPHRLDGGRPGRHQARRHGRGLGRRRRRPDGGPRRPCCSGAEKVFVIDRLPERLAQVRAAHRRGDARLRAAGRRRGTARADRRPWPRRLHRGGRHGGAQLRADVPATTR